MVLVMCHSSFAPLHQLLGEWSADKSVVLAAEQHKAPVLAMVQALELAAVTTTPPMAQTTRPQALWAQAVTHAQAPAQPSALAQAMTGTTATLAVAQGTAVARLAPAVVMTGTTPAPAVEGLVVG